MSGTTCNIMVRTILCEKEIEHSRPDISRWVTVTEWMFEKAYSVPRTSFQECNKPYIRQRTAWGFSLLFTSDRAYCVWRRSKRVTETEWSGTVQFICSWGTGFEHHQVYEPEELDVYEQNYLRRVILKILIKCSELISALIIVSVMSINTVIC